MKTQTCTEILPDDPRYPALIRGFNQRWVGSPKYIDVCRDTDDVIRAVQQAVDKGLRITVRGGGHCYENFVSDNHGGVIIDLSLLTSVYKAADDDLYCVEGGCTLWNVYTRLFKEYGKTFPGGSCYSVGAGGHIIGGGYGLLSRLHGLVVDYLDAVEVVCVNKDHKAEIVTVSAGSATEEERRLFWAHTGGGGGNFGIVTRYWFKGLPKAPAIAYLGTMAWEWAEMTAELFTELVNKYGSFLKENSSPKSPYAGLFALLHLTQRAAGQIVLTIQYVGDEPGLLDKFMSYMQLTGLDHVDQRVPVGFHHIVHNAATPRRMPWIEATQTLNGSGPNQRGKYKSAYMTEPFPPHEIDIMWEYLSTDKFSNPQALLQVDSYGCQINAVAPDATAVPQRSSIMKLQYQTYWTEPAEDKINLDWINGFYTAMYGPRGPYPDGKVDGCYVNYPDVDLVDWEYLYYKENYPLLQSVKSTWDPNNIFNHRQSINAAK